MLSSEQRIAKDGPKIQSLAATTRSISISTLHALISQPDHHNMFKPNPTYDRVAAAEAQAELDDWHEEPIESVESRSHQVNLHRRPGFYKKGLLASVAANAVLLMICGWLYLKLRV